MTENDTAPAPCAGSGAWAGWGWSWYPCPVCGQRIDTDEDTLSLIDHPAPVIEAIARKTSEAAGLGRAESVATVND